jgi:hypothetical protein
MSTGKAAFGRRVPLVNLDKHTPVPGRLVFQLADKLPPSHIANRLGKRMVLDHVLDLQTLDTDQRHATLSDKSCLVPYMGNCTDSGPVGRGVCTLGSSFSSAEGSRQELDAASLEVWHEGICPVCLALYTANQLNTQTIQVKV